MAIVGGFDVHRRQITFDYLDTQTGEVKTGRIEPADRHRLRAWLARFEGCPQVAFAVEACTGWGYVVEELERAGVEAHLAPADAAALRGKKRRAKTDKADARHQRELLVDGRLPEAWIAPSHVLEARALGRLCIDLMEERRAWMQRKRAQLFHQGCPPRARSSVPRSSPSWPRPSCRPRAARRSRRRWPSSTGWPARSSRCGPSSATLPGARRAAGH